ncbi:hypothetical protein ON010_g14693 [Phytophthora cinnamomi]|nr:hypothetical protein ON010_g14693 [Phytophthora cinnamomi]
MRLHSTRKALEPLHRLNRVAEDAVSIEECSVGVIALGHVELVLVAVAELGRGEPTSAAVERHETIVLVGFELNFGADEQVLGLILRKDTNIVVAAHSSRHVLAVHFLGGHVRLVKRHSAVLAAHGRDRLHTGANRALTKQCQDLTERLGVVVRANVLHVVGSHCAVHWRTHADPGGAIINAALLVGNRASQHQGAHRVGHKDGVLDRALVCIAGGAHGQRVLANLFLQGLVRPTNVQRVQGRVLDGRAARGVVFHVAEFARGRLQLFLLLLIALSVDEKARTGLGLALAPGGAKEPHRLFRLKLSVQLRLLFGGAGRHHQGQQGERSRESSAPHFSAEQRGMNKTASIEEWRRELSIRCKARANPMISSPAKHENSISLFCGSRNGIKSIQTARTPMERSGEWAAGRLEDFDDDDTRSRNLCIAE